MKKIIYWFPPIVWMGIIFYSSAQPYENQDMKPFLSNYINLSFLEPFVDWIKFTYHHSEVSVDTLGIYGFVEFFLRKGAHVTVFFTLMVTFYYAISKTSRLTNKGVLMISFGATAAYACLDELHQGITPNRTPYVGDILLDCFGAFLAALAIIYIRKFRYKRMNKNVNR